MAPLQRGAGTGPFLCPYAVKRHPRKAPGPCGDASDLPRESASSLLQSGLWVAPVLMSATLHAHTYSQGEGGTNVAPTHAHAHAHARTHPAAHPASGGAGPRPAPPAGWGVGALPDAPSQGPGACRRPVWGCSGSLPGHQAISPWLLTTGVGRCPQGPGALRGTRPGEGEPR